MKSTTKIIAIVAGVCVVAISAVTAIALVSRSKKLKAENEGIFEFDTDYDPEPYY